MTIMTGDSRESPVFLSAPFDTALMHAGTPTTV
jgi:hypothetical protein